MADYEKRTEYRLSGEHVSLIEMIVARGDRAEVVPVKDGLKILRARREEVKMKRNH